MSKAFVRESDEEPDAPAFSRAASVSAGVKNYLTEGGYRRLRGELVRLVEVERPRLAALPEDSEAKRELGILNQRARHLQQVLQSAEVVPPGGAGDHVRFGATVAVRERGGVESIYRLVGAEETDVERGWVSWQSPLARALLNARPGERVAFSSPAGRRELAVLRVSYE